MASIAARPTPSYLFGVLRKERDGERRREDLPEAAIERVEIDVLDGLAIEFVAVELPASLGLADVDPVGGVVGRAGEAVTFDKERPWNPTAGRHMGGWQERGVPTSAELSAWLEADDRRVNAGKVPANIGCRCGPGCLGDDGLIGADADGEQGIADLAQALGLRSGVLEAALAEYRSGGLFLLNLGTAAYLTQSGGLRVLWRARSGAKLRTVGGDKGHEGLGLYWQGKQVVLPPSVGPEGPYCWLPGHSPWQIGFTQAPASVLAAMSSGAVGTSIPRLVSVVVSAYPAATEDRGPDRNGRLVNGSGLPYDVHLLHDGVAKGERSESVFQLATDMQRAGWSDAETASVLWSADWIRARYRQAVRLANDVARIFGKRGARSLAAAGAEAGATVSWTGETRRVAGAVSPGGDTAETASTGSETGFRRTSRPDAKVADEVDHDAEERAAIRAEGCAASAVPDGRSESRAPEEPPAAPGWAYGRQRDGCRLRTREPERDQAVRDGLGQIHDFAAGLPHPTRSHQRILRQTERLQGGFDRCRQTAWAHHHDLRDPGERTRNGGAWLWTDAPCDGRGHEECAPFHALRELRAQWGPALEEVYGSGPVVALALSAPGWGLEATRKAGTAFLEGSKVRASLGLCAGFLLFEPGAAPGYTLHLLVPFHRAGDLRDLLLREWRRHVACGWLRTVDDLPPQPTALEALVELRVRSEQSILLSLGRGEVDMDRAVRLYAAETGAFSGSDVGGQRQRLVMAPGMRALAQEIAAGRQQMVMAVGDARGGAPGPGSPAADGTEGPAPAIAGRGPSSVNPFPLSGPAVPRGPSPARLPGGSAGSAGPGQATPTGDDEGWVPCPWDPSLEMRPSRTRKGRPRALPWWKLEQMAARGEVVPIMHNGRLIGYRERATGSRRS